MTFSELGLSPKVLTAVEASGYTIPTPIQAAAIPHVLQRRDMIGVAQTGTGKTASFTLPMLTLLEQGRARARMPRTLILEPTRELAAQVEENFVKYGLNHRLTVALLIGGVSFDEQEKKLDRGADVLIATPGRLLDHFGRGKLLLNGVEILVIDEADRMLDMGFIPDIERICKLCTRPHQSLFFSATMPAEIQRLADTFLNDPVKIEVARPATTAKTVTQYLVKVGREPQDKRDALRELIAGATDLKNAIVFCNRKRDVATLYRSLEKSGFNVGSLHGDMEQRARMATLDAFRKGTLTLLVASDVAARGLDIPEVSHVFNFDVPTHAEDYVHRIGRTGRAGRSGTAMTLVAPSDTKYIAGIEKLIGETITWFGGDVAVAEVEAPEVAEEAAAAPATSSRRRGSGSADRDSDGDRSRGGGGNRRGGGRGERRPAAAAPVAAEAAPKPEAAPQPRKAEAAPQPRRTPAAEPAPARRAQAAEPAAPRRAPAEAPVRQQPEDRRPQAAAPQPPAQPRREEQRPAGRRDDFGQQRRRHRPDFEDDVKVIGLGDHVPAFLLRPVRVEKQAS
ncbi:DEAD/DEAH box helicase [Methylobrevis albus]|uniref:DEAD-box ATP-dependent RNA helicase RhpA n=1 Tax=Methylobrevis albus TaxID=2793297 RepID=A0A931MZ67_9HYPH|nr:DEAD/DEAH box helicase [Methylobrevis albus]MBH0239167.1 DEAD/DEAH box helicase [Methylobrevis albus]